LHARQLVREELVVSLDAGPRAAKTGHEVDQVIEDDQEEGLDRQTARHGHDQQADQQHCADSTGNPHVRMLAEVVRRERCQRE
jgi:hypothetical protein